MTKREEKEQEILYQYQSNLRKNENKIEEVERKKRTLEKRIEDIFDFRTRIFYFLKEEMKDQTNKDEQQDLDSMEDELFTNFRNIEQKCEEERESLLKDENHIREKEASYITEYHRQIRRLEEEESDKEP